MLNVKYRPKKIEQLVGNSSVKESLLSLFKRDRKEIPQVYLFTGKAGTGKTTMAYILKSQLGCSDMDFSYYNTANTRGIDTIRAIIENSTYVPVEGKVKMYVLDECHQISHDAMEALLNILEKPPENVYFVLCTTEPNKIPPTIKRRCSEYEMEPLLRPEMAKFLKRIVKRERKEIKDSVLEKIIDVSEGSAGLALKLLDSVIDMKDEKEAIKIIESRTISEKNIIHLCRSLIKNNNWDNIRKILIDLEGDPERNRRAVLSYFKKVLLFRGNDKVAEMMMCFMDPVFYTGDAGFVHCCYLACKVK